MSLRPFVVLCICAAAAVRPVCGADGVAIESDGSGGIILRVAEGSSVSIAYGNAEPEAMVTRQELDDVVALLSMTRNEATRRDTAMKAMQSTLDALAGSPAALKEVNAEVVALAAAVGGYQKCFDAGKLPGGDDCLDAAASYAECDPEKLEVPDNAEVYAGTGTLPGTARLFKCNSGYALQGEAAVHCMQDGSWEDTPTCKEQPTTTAVTTTANPNKAWNYWRVANAGATTWVPVVSEFMLFPHTHDGKCGGNRITEFNAATEDASTFLCSGAHRNNEKQMGCHFALDLVSDTGDSTETLGAWRPQCGSKEGGCKKGEAWIGVHFVEPTFVKCIQLLGDNGNPTYSLGRGKGLKSNPWEGGLLVEVSDDGAPGTWLEIAVEDQGRDLNTAIIINGKP